MRRITAFLIGLGAALVVVWMANRDEERAGPEAPAVDLVRARAALREGDPETIEPVAARVARIRPTPVEWLLEGLRDEDRHVREWSAVILGDAALLDRAAVANDDVVHALMRAFEDEDDWVRWKAARALGNIGPAARAALPMLQKAAQDVREEVVHAAAQKAVTQILGQPYPQPESK